MATDGGKLTFHIIWDGQVVRKVDIASTRPHAFRLLNGQVPDKAVQMARLLFNVCGNAQGAAAAAAVAAAQGRVLPDRAAMERGIACEAMQEHLWRLLLDWPKMLGLPHAQADFVRWHGMLRSIAAGQGEMATVRTEFEARWLGCPSGKWEAHSLEALQSWWQASDSPAARLLAALDEADAGDEPDSGIVVLPDWTAAQAAEVWGDRLDADFAARPQLQGNAAEAGALGYYAQRPLLQEVMRKRPSRVLARVMARVLDILHIAAEGYDGRLESTQLTDGTGLAVVRTARGMLLHRVRLDPGRVGDYLIVAPTEWNFHQQGALAKGLERMPVGSRGRLLQVAGAHVLSLDPCVEYEIEVSHA